MEIMPKNIQLTFTPSENADAMLVNQRFCEAAGVNDAAVVWRKRSLDARGKQPFFIITADVYGAGELPPVAQGFLARDVHGAAPVHIIGSGPAGLFAALSLIEQGFKPIVLERGKPVKERRRDLAVLNKEHIVDGDSNYCFGEGGAGTYSDGKLYTRSTKRGDVAKILQELVHHGATSAITWEAHPHIGTNKLPGIIENIREHIIACGGEVHFGQKMVDFTLENDKIREIQTQNGQKWPVQALILATGHSARDIFTLLHKKKVHIEAKPFALGVRLEHPQELIDTIQYKCNASENLLPPASYSLVEQVNGRGVFSFCMCPGGIIAPAATTPGEVVVNGWSPSKRNGKFANSGFVVSVDEKDFAAFEKHGPLKAMEYQAVWEKKAFETAGNLTAPAQRIEDFVNGKLSSDLPECSYIPGIAPRKMDDVLSEDVGSRIRGALQVLGNKMKGFRTRDGILVGVESRTSSPVRIPRDKENLQHPQVQNLYPCGEGAGYAGGIISAALDGVRCAEAAALTLQHV
jgi:uncharacterized FAD-dependent dehydrogenase